VSLLGEEEIKEFEQKKDIQLEPGAFAENVTTQGLNLGRLEVGAELKLGKNIRLKISQIGKECHQNCTIRELTGDCIMPTRGLFARVIHGGKARKGDRIEVL
jgi:cyclic pyranopterin phosphate synthase